MSAPGACDQGTLSPAFVTWGLFELVRRSGSFRSLSPAPLTGQDGASLSLGFPHPPRRPACLLGSTRKNESRVETLVAVAGGCWRDLGTGFSPTSSRTGQMALNAGGDLGQVLSSLSVSVLPSVKQGIGISECPGPWEASKE